MSDLGKYKKEIKGHMEKAEKDFKDFIKVMLENKPEPYMELGSVQVFEDLMITSNAINKLKYTLLELDIKIKETMTPREGQEKNANANKMTGKASTNSKDKENNKCEKNGVANGAAASTSPKEEQGANAATKKPEENPKTEKSEEQGAASGFVNFDGDKTKMILELYELNEYHKAIIKQWSEQVRDMIKKGGRINWVSLQKQFWMKFEHFGATALGRLIE